MTTSELKETGQKASRGRHHAVGELNGHKLNRLGIERYNEGDYAKAIQFYRASARHYQASAAESHHATTPLLNMGLVFNHAEVSQDADAVDAYRRALIVDLNNEKAKERLGIAKQKLVPLAARARSAVNGLVHPDEHFQFYVSPFEAFAMDDVEGAESVDVKRVQRAKKLLLQEIDLNDGKVSWLDDYSLDRSRALTLEDELHDRTKRRYHWAVFQNERLRRFLSRGENEHFLYSDDYFPCDTLELLDEEPEFRAFLSKPFARQYNLLLTRAIERRAIPVVEVLLDGRRWVEPEDEDICFEGAYRRVDDLLSLMRSKTKGWRERKPNLPEIDQFLRDHTFPDLFNLLPTAFFGSLQTELVREIRSLAITCYCIAQGSWETSCVSLLSG